MTGDGWELLDERIKAMMGKPFVMLRVHDEMGMEKPGFDEGSLLLIPVADLMGLFDRVKALEEDMERTWEAANRI